MALFGNKAEKTAQDEAAKAEVDRLLALPVAGLAAELMPAFGPEGKQNPHGLGDGRTINILQVLEWLLSSFPRSSGYWPDLEQSVREGLQALEQASLIERRVIGQGTRLCATRLGEEALADGSVTRRLSPAEAGASPDQN